MAQHLMNQHIVLADMKGTVGTASVEMRDPQIIQKKSAFRHRMSVLELQGDSEGIRKEMESYVKRSQNLGSSLVTSQLKVAGNEDEMLAEEETKDH